MAVLKRNLFTFSVLFYTKLRTSGCESIVGGEGFVAIGIICADQPIVSYSPVEMVTRELVAGGAVGQIIHTVYSVIAGITDLDRVDESRY